MATKHDNIQASAMEGEALDNLIIAQNNVEAVKSAMNASVARALEEIGLRAEGYAKRELSKPKGGHKSGEDPRPNVDTGRLRNSITHQTFPDEGYVVVGTNVEYAPNIELGTSRHEAWPYLHPAATEHGDEYREVLRKHLQNA